MVFMEDIFDAVNQMGLDTTVNAEIPGQFGMLGVVTEVRCEDDGSATLIVEDNMRPVWGNEFVTGRYGASMPVNVEFRTMYTNESFMTPEECFIEDGKVVLR